MSFSFYIRQFVVLCLISFLLDSAFGEKKIGKSDLTRKGEKEYAKANHDTALKIFKKSIQQGDMTGFPRFFIGIILETKRKYRESIKYYIEAVERPLAKEYQKAAFWKIILYFQQTNNYAQLLEYSDELKSLIGKSKRLEEIIMNAELNVTPIHIEARKKIKIASEIKASYASKSKKKSFWKDYASQIKEVAGIYERVAQMHDRYRNLAWQAASYYEHLDLFDDAIRTYSWITNDKNSSKANYKIGVILRKQTKYRDAAEYLNNVISSEHAKKKLKYYAHINISQAHYGNQNFIRSEETAKKALSNKFAKQRTNYQRQILYLIQCNSSLQLSEIIRRSEEKKIINILKKKFLPCYSYIKREGFFEKSKNYSLITLSKLVRGKWFHLVSETNVKFYKKYSVLALTYYAEAFLFFFPEKQEPKIENQINTNKERKGVTVYYQTIDLKSKKINRKDWCLSELEEVVGFISQANKYQALKKFISEYANKLKMNPGYPIWLANSYFHTGDYMHAYQAFQEVHNRSLILEKKLLLSFANLQKWEAFQQEFKNYIAASIDSKEEMILFLKSEKVLLEFRGRENFAKFLTEIQIIGKHDEKI